MQNNRKMFQKRKKNEKMCQKEKASLVKGRLGVSKNLPLRGRCPEGAEPPRRGGQGVNAPFSTVCATAMAYLCLLFYTLGVRHRKWQNEKGFWLLVKIHRAPFSINSCCCNFIFAFLLCSLRDLLTSKATALSAIAYQNFPKCCMPS